MMAIIKNKAGGKKRAKKKKSNSKQLFGVFPCTPPFPQLLYRRHSNASSIFLPQEMLSSYWADRWFDGFSIVFSCT